MSLAELRLADLRCLEAAELTLHPRLNLVTGENGSGKTSVLEAIYLLGRGRSFRTRHTEQLIRHGQPRLQLFGRVQRTGAAGDSADRPLSEVPSRAIGVQCSRQDGITARIDAQPIGSLVQLSEAFPVQVVDPGIHRLVEEGPIQRRRWLDWAVFHVEPNFVGQWQGYTRALRQRNAALKIGADPTLWNPELIRAGEQLTSARQRLVEALQPFWTGALRTVRAPEVSLGFFRGWGGEQTLEELLTTHLVRDRERGSTVQGPHRFDVPLRWDGRLARDVVSRGQQKLLGAAMALTMSRFVADAVGTPPTLLLDDPSAELDAAHTEALMAAVGELGGQQIVTALRPQDTALGTPDRVFHVEQKGVKQL